MKQKDYFYLYLLINNKTGIVQQKTRGKAQL